ncbi:MAG: hypothetical protein LBK41_09050 [Clostridiales bacterium]|jgi:hypothetical protein|nr:hypothetical protein [Clostridiales bacterium]
MADDRFGEAIRAPLRSTRARLRFALVAPEAKENAVVSGAESPISRKWQVTDDMSEPGAAIATFEPGYWRLDGAFALPRPPGETAFEVGWWGAEISGADGAFASPQILTVDLAAPADCHRFGAAFDEASDEAAAEARFTAYNGSGEILLDETVVCSEGFYAATESGALGVKRLTVEVIRTRNPFRYARVAEADFGVTLSFGPERIESLDMIQESDPDGKSFRYNSLDVTITNNGDFDMFDPDGPARYLTARQALEYRHGASVFGSGGVSWVNCGVFYLTGWTVTAKTVELNCLGKAHVLDDRSAPDLSGTALSAGEAAAAVVAAAGFSGIIAPALYESPPAEFRFGDISARRALSAIAEAAGCLLFEERNGAIRFAEAEAPGAAASEIGFADMPAAPSASMEKYANGVTLTEYGETKTETFYPAPWKDPSEPEYAEKLDVPAVYGTEFRGWLLARRFAALARRLRIAARYRGDPRIAVGARARVRTSGNGRTADGTVYGHTLSYARGELSGEIKLIGGGAP